MKKQKILLPIAICSIILVVCLAIPFIIYGSAGESVTIRGVKGSYAEVYANANGIDFVELYDSENPAIDAPATGTTAAAEQTTAPVTQLPAAGENKDFAYNYEGNSVNVTDYKGNEKVVIVPSEIDGLPVSAVTIDAAGKGISVIEIPQSVSRIEGRYSSSAFTPAFYAAVIMMIVGYAFAVVSTLIGMKKADTAESTFYGVPFVYSGVVTFIAICVWSLVAMFLKVNPTVQIIIDIVIIAVACVKLFSRNAAKEIIEERGKEVKQKTLFTKMLSADASVLISKASVPEEKAACERVFEAIRYSDPMSDTALAGIESQISVKFSEFSAAIGTAGTGTVNKLADELIILVEDRNKRCMLLK